MTLFEQAERIAAKPWFFIGFNAAIVVAWVVSGVDASNWLISIVTGELVLLGLGMARRSQLGIHAKLDALIIATAGAPDDLARIEEQPEHVIAEKRR